MDANLYLGRLHPRWFLGGQMQLDVARAKEAVAAFASQVRMAPEAAWEGILEVVNANMEGAIRVISVERGHDPREFALVSFGGAGSMHAADLARPLSIPTVLVPANPGILSAFGMLITDYVQEYAQTVLVPATSFTSERATVAFRELEERGRQAMRDEGVAPQDVQISRFLDMSYVGQSFELMVPYSPNFIEEFNPPHDMGLGFEAHARPTRAPVSARQALAPGNRFSGPALITEYSATTVVPADFVARVDQQHNLILRPGAAPSPTGRGQG